MLLYKHKIINDKKGIVMSVEHGNIKTQFTELMRIQDEINEHLQSMIVLQKTLSQKENELKKYMLNEKQLVANVVRHMQNILGRLN